MGKILIALFVVGFAFSVSAGSISLVSQANLPEPNEEITVYVQTDTPLFAMGIGVYIVGDANITTAMSEADCNQYGWDNGWNSDPYIDPNGWVYVNGVRWNADANGTIGYFKFRYNSGQISVYIDQENSLAFGWDGNSCPEVPFSTNTLLFGEPDPNQMMQGGQQPDLPEPADANQSLLPLAPREDTNPRQPKNLKLYSLDINAGGLLCAADFKQASEIQSPDSVQSQMDGPLSTIEVTLPITSNQIWTADNIYHVTTDVDVQALLVIEPGTVVQFGPNGTLWINNGGALISSGTPDKPITYTADTTTSSYQYYWYPVYVEPTASPASRITYSIFRNARVGLFIEDNELDNPVENNCFFHNTYGIVEFGTRHADIINNLIYDTYSEGIEVSMMSAASIADANSHIRIANNTCHYYQDYGIVVFGADNSADAGVVEFYNNVVSGSYVFGSGFSDYAYWAISNTGFYNNANNSNAVGDFPVYATSNPYINGSGDPNRCFLNQACPFINAGLEYIEQTPLIGKTTDLTGTPDSNKTDIGFHHPNWNFVNANTGFAAGDFNKDTITDFKDLYTLTANWLNSVTPGSGPDLNSDGTVNFKDFTLFANTWGQTQGEPNITPVISGDANDITGEFQIGIAGIGVNTCHAYVMIDGQFIDEIADLSSTDSNVINIDSRTFRNGAHTVKACTLDSSGNLTVSQTRCLVFNNSLSCLSASDTFEGGNTYNLSAFYSGNEDLYLELYNWNNNLIWMSASSSGGLNVAIPSSLLNSQIYDVKIQKSGGMMLESSGTDYWEKSISKKYVPTESYKFAIFLTGSWSFLDWLADDGDPADQMKEAVAAIVQACEGRHISYVVLYKKQCNWANFASVLSSHSVSYVYMVSRGGFSISRGSTFVQRTWFELADSKVCSYKKSDFGGSPPENYEELPGDWETSPQKHSMHSLGLAYSHQMRIVHLDFCFQGRYWDMMSEWLTPDILDNLFVSWSQAVQSTHPNQKKWSKDIWTRLGNGTDRYYDAQYYAAMHNDWGAYLLGKVALAGSDQVTFTNEGNQ
jgi:hypothetical protein